MTMKYVILVVENKDLGYMRAYPFVFPQYITHSIAKEHFAALVVSEVGLVPDFLSAGFCDVVLHEYACVSGSESIGHLGSDDRSREDQRILNMPDAFQGIIA